MVKFDFKKALKMATYGGVAEHLGAESPSYIKTSPTTPALRGPDLAKAAVKGNQTSSSLIKGMSNVAKKTPSLLSKAVALAKTPVSAAVANASLAGTAIISGLKIAEAGIGFNRDIKKYGKETIANANDVLKYTIKNKEKLATRRKAKADLDKKAMDKKMKSVDWTKWR